MDINKDFSVGDDTDKGSAIRDAVQVVWGSFNLFEFHGVWA